MAGLLSAAVGLAVTASRADETSARWVAALPFGAGQFHRGDVGLGVFFAVGQALLGGASAGSSALAQYYASQDLEAPGPDGRFIDRQALGELAKAVTFVNRATFAGWAALTLSGVIEAQIQLGRRGAESREPAKVPVQVSAGALPGGAAVEMRWQF
ncbi:MAG: hypothetical protein R3F14_14345 [Polyangiaceae bacterium]